MTTELIIIDEGWQVEPFSVVPIGKRVKRTVTSPSEETFYFKEPEPKYPWEFWTEIAASKIGQLFKFNIVNYEIGIYQQSIGCISKSMINASDELIHGQQFLTQLNPDFDKKRGTDHSFQILEALFLNDIRLKGCFDKVIEMLIFDAIVGNRDRHQQNWAIIRTIEVSEDITSRWILYIKRWFNKKANEITHLIKETNRFSPLFDNGNCLAYNMTDVGINGLLHDDERLSAYAFGKKATSHIRWGEHLLTHFDLLKNVKAKHKVVGVKVKEYLDRYDKSAIRNVICSLDDKFDRKNFPNNLLSDERKELMIRLIEIRVEKLKELL